MANLTVRRVKVTEPARENSALVRAELYRALVHAGVRVAMGQRFKLAPRRYPGARTRYARTDVTVLGEDGQVLLALNVPRYLRAGDFLTKRETEVQPTEGPGSLALGVPWFWVPNRAAVPAAVRYCIVDAELRVEQERSGLTEPRED